MSEIEAILSIEVTCDRCGRIPHHDPQGNPIGNGIDPFLAMAPRPGEEHGVYLCLGCRIKDYEASPSALGAVVIEAAKTVPVHPPKPSSAGKKSKATDPRKPSRAG